MRILISWVGRTDLEKANEDRPEQQPGPVLRLIQRERFDRVHLLNDITAAERRDRQASPDEYLAWLARCVGLPPDAITLHHAPANLRNQYGETYRFTRDKLKQIREQYPMTVRFALLLSPGAPAAQVAMLIGAQTIFDPDTELFNTWQPADRTATGVEPVTLGYSLSVDVVPDLLRRLQREFESAPLHPSFERIVGQSRAMAAAKQAAQRVAVHSDISVLLRGETGTGKELFARAIHETSPRHEGPFLAVNCAAIPRELLESELFGHVKGAFTGAVSARRGKVAAADGGTLLLDEIGDMALDLQAKLLRFLQERRYTPVGSDTEEESDVRVLAATHQDLESAMAAGRFREDLFYRLNVVSIYLPPLRERGQDVRVLAQTVLASACARLGLTRTLSDGALQLLSRRAWRGNVRELENAVTRLIVLSQVTEITAEEVELWLDAEPPAPLRAPVSQLSPDQFAAHLAALADELLRRFKREGTLPWGSADEPDLFEDVLYPILYGRAMQMTNGNKTQAGELFQKSGLDAAKTSYQRHMERYATMRQRIDEIRVQQVRGHDQ